MAKCTASRSLQSGSALQEAYTLTGGVKRSSRTPLLYAIAGPQQTAALDVGKPALTECWGMSATL